MRKSGTSTDALAREQAMTPEERLRLHQNHRGPVMKQHW